MNWQGLSDILTFVWLFSLMLLMGLSATFQNVFGSLREIKPLIKALAANYLIVPVICCVLLRLLDPDSLTRAGFLIAVVFCGAPMAPAFTSLAGGDVPFSVGLMVLLAVVTPFLSPLVLDFLLPFISQPEQVSVDFWSVITIIAIGQILPIVFGMTLRQFAPGVAARAVRPIKWLISVLLVAITILIVVFQFRQLGIFGFKALLGSAILFAVSALTGWFFGGPEAGRKKALMLNTTVRNVAAALLVVSTNFPNSPAVTAVVAYSLFAVAASLGVARVLGWSEKRVCKSGFP